MLVVELRKVIPDHQKLKIYEIDTTGSTKPSDTV